LTNFKAENKTNGGKYFFPKLSFWLKLFQFLKLELEPLLKLVIKYGFCGGWQNLFDSFYFPE